MSALIAARIDAHITMLPASKRDMFYRLAKGEFGPAGVEDFRRIVRAWLECPPVIG